jgi:hypothetical protein
LQFLIAEGPREGNETLEIVGAAFPILAFTAQPLAGGAGGVEEFVGVTGEAVALQFELMSEPALRLDAAERQGGERNFLQRLAVGKDFCLRSGKEWKGKEEGPESEFHVPKLEGCGGLEDSPIGWALCEVKGLAPVLMLYGSQQGCIAESGSRLHAVQGAGRLIECHLG